MNGPSRLLVGVVALLVGCGESSPAAPSRTSRTVLDATGAAVALPTKVRRIVATVPGLSATVEALGAGDLLVAVSSVDPTSGPRAALPRIPVPPTIPAETVATFAPDLVLVDPTLSPRDVAPLRGRFPGTFASDSRSLDGLRTTFLRLGAALDRGAEAARLVGELDAARAEAKAPGAPSVLLLTWADPPSVVALGPGSLLDDMLRSVGATNVAAELGRPSGAIASEVVVSRAPAWILLTGATFSDELRRRWASVPAVREGRVVDAGGDAFVQAGPATAGALRRLAAMLSGTGGAR